MTHLIFSAMPQPRRDIAYVHPEITVAECIDSMTKQDIGALVVHDGKKLIGMVTERDIIRTCLNKSKDLHKTLASDIAYLDVSVLNILDPIEKAMEVIILTKRRHILVEEHDKLVAVLSIGDLLYHLLEDRTHIIEQLENYIHNN